VGTISGSVVHMGSDESTRISGLSWVHDQAKNSVNPSVVNMSLGSPASTALDDAVKSVKDSALR
jgi:hypothetical protein